MSTKSSEQQVSIKAPNMKVLEIEIVGTAPYVQHRFSQKAIEQIIATQKAGGQAKGKTVREPKDFDAVYKGAMHMSSDGWHGIPAAAFRNGMVSACRTVGYKMTHAKLAASILADGFDGVDGMPLVKLSGTPRKHTAYARNDNGSVDIRVRPMWEKWGAKLRVQFDADMFSATDIVNLLMRVGAQVGIGEGRPDSKNSAGLGWGLFEIKKHAEMKNVA